LVDVIYPALACFAKMVDEPIGRGKKLCAVLQEAFCKDVQRAFGAAQFYDIKKEVEHWYLNYICWIVESAIILHNMMVKYWADCGQEENILFDKVDDKIEVNSNAIDMDEESVNCNNAELMLH
jgi:Plant transposon protein